MGFMGQRIAETIQNSANNLGGALLRQIERQKEQDRFDRQQGLLEEIQRGQLQLGKDKLAQDASQFQTGTEQTYRLHGFAPSEAARAVAETPTLNGPVSLFDGQKLGLATIHDPAVRPSPAGALLSILSGGKGSASAPRAPLPTSAAPSGPAPLPATDPFAGWNYHTERDPEAVRQAVEITARTEAANADRTSREGIANRSNQTQRDVAGIYAGQRQAATDAAATEARAGAVAVSMVEKAGGIDAAIQQASAMPESPAKAAVLQALRTLLFEQRRRNILGIGSGSEDNALLRALHGGNAGGTP